MTEPKVGQVWIDRDKRVEWDDHYLRKVTVISVDMVDGVCYQEIRSMRHFERSHPLCQRTLSSFVKAFMFEGEPTQGELKA